MPRISINEIDNTTYSINGLTNDNIVYVWKSYVCLF